MKGITGKTVVCGIIGDPIEHSISPAMQNAAFQALGLDYIYTAFRVEPQQLDKAIQGLRAFEIRGLNVTIPHKTAVISLLDEIDSMAAKLGAVNTIVNNQGSLKGYNTDAAGFYQALKSQGVDPACKYITILGAGGAARAVAFVLAEKKANLTILNRDEARARSLADSLTRILGCKVSSGNLVGANLKSILDTTEILINTTSVGMSPQVGTSPIPAGMIQKRHIVIDIIYNPLETPLLAEAAASGAKTIGGIEMLVQQGAAAFELWTSCQAPVEVMRRAALEAMQRN